MTSEALTTAVTRSVGVTYVKGAYVSLADVIKEQMTMLRV